ncbi:signal peptidase II [Synoicihabitans lomoniglobus]|uniref:Lipoprotein signal peptidase n=1 Tax=Synoicihabitans lomoniglobus TaxID=2909285 RepID=A0AAF0CQM0_9BACT|nr:signal peptidase II [Opitutaceae bacterium LMO-M01]WED66259.1 signal peptidase II [Opitutaceae bacterium LMO-M01]
MTSSPRVPAPDPEAVAADTPAPTTLGVGQRLGAYRLLWVLAIVVLVLDQLTKLWIVERMPLGTYGPERGAITIIDGFFYLVHVGNTGAAWSLFTGRSTLLALLAGSTLAAIYFWRRALGLRDRMVQLSFGLLCGGIVGNLIDRVAYGHVVDFLDFHFGSYVYPTFNVADSGICIGVGIYLIHSLRHPPEQESNK